MSNVEDTKKKSKEILKSLTERYDDEGNLSDSKLEEVEKGLFDRARAKKKEEAANAQPAAAPKVVDTVGTQGAKIGEGEAGAVGQGQTGKVGETNVGQVGQVGQTGQEGQVVGVADVIAGQEQVAAGDKTGMEGVRGKVEQEGKIDGVLGEKKIQETPVLPDVKGMQTVFVDRSNKIKKLGYTKKVWDRDTGREMEITVPPDSPALQGTLNETEKVMESAKNPVEFFKNLETLHQSVGSKIPPNMYDPDVVGIMISSTSKHAKLTPDVKKYIGNQILGENNGKMFDLMLPEEKEKYGDLIKDFTETIRAVVDGAGLPPGFENEERLKSLALRLGFAMHDKYVTPDTANKGIKYIREVAEGRKKKNPETGKIMQPTPEAMETAKKELVLRKMIYSVQEYFWETFGHNRSVTTRLADRFFTEPSAKEKFMMLRNKPIEELIKEMDVDSESMEKAIVELEEEDYEIRKDCRYLIIQR